jgi:ABC-type glycerol-3-phosphate transport system substrate-binding protein/DNA-binding transcriptional regulator YhcF (GntR family)
LYRQLKELIKDAIRRGKFRPGDRLPTEMELCETYGVSRITVRQALNELAREGFLYRQQGSGTFVTDRIPSKIETLRVIVPEEIWAPPLKKAVRIYNRETSSSWPRVQLEVPIMGGPRFHPEIASAVGRGQAPDAALIDSVRLMEFVDLHYIEPLDEVDADWVEEYKRDLLPLFIRSSTSQGHLWGVPIDATLAVLWYRKDILAAERLPPPTTWEELVAVAQHLQQESCRRRHNLGPFVLAFPGGPEAEEITTFILSSLIWSAGGELNRGERIVLDEGANQALQFLHDLVHSHQVASPDVVFYGWKTVPWLFGEGKVAIAFGGSYEKSLIQEVSGWDEEEFRKRVGFLPVPAGPQGSQVTTAGGMVYVLFRQSKHPKIMVEILKITSSPSLVREFCCRTGRMPALVPVMNSLDSQREWFTYECTKLLKLARVRPVISQYIRVSEQLRLMLANVLLGKKAVEQAVAHAQAVIEALTG